MKENSREEQDFRHLYQIYATEEKTRDWTKQMREKAFYSYRDRPLAREAALALFGRTLLGSVSRLEQYASCAYAPVSYTHLDVYKRQRLRHGHNRYGRGKGRGGYDADR